MSLNFPSYAPYQGFDIPGLVGFSATSRANVAADATVTFDELTRVFTITPTGTTFSVWRSGRLEQYGIKTVTLPDVTGVYYITLNAAGNLVASTTPWNLFADIPVQLVYYYRNGATIRSEKTEERHGAMRSLAWHYWAHTSVGCRYVSGFQGTFTNTTLSVTQGTIEDEDINFTSSGTLTSCRLWWYDGANMTFNDAITTPYAVSGGALQFDNAGTLTAVSVNNYVINDVYSTSDNDRAIWVRVGTTQYANITAARAALGTVSSMNNIPTNEMKLLYQVIYRNQGGVITFIESRDFRNASTVPGSGIFNLPAHASSHGFGGSDPITTLGAVVETGAYNQTDVALTDAATIAVDAALGNNFSVTLTASRTMGVPSNPVNNQMMLFKIKQGGTGSYTITWPSGAGGYQFSASLPAPTLSTAVGAYDYIGFKYDAASNRWNCLSALGGFT